MAGDGKLASALGERQVFSAGTSWLAWRCTGGKEKVMPWAFPRPDWVTRGQGQMSRRDIGKKAIFLLQTKLQYQLGS